MFPDTFDSLMYLSICNLTLLCVYVGVEIQELGVGAQILCHRVKVREELAGGSSL